jgi:hypothetical protein
MHQRASDKDHEEQRFLVANFIMFRYYVVYLKNRSAVLGQCSYNLMLYCSNAGVHVYGNTGMHVMETYACLRALPFARSKVKVVEFRVRLSIAPRGSRIGISGPLARIPYEPNAFESSDALCRDMTRLALLVLLVLSSLVMDPCSELGVGRVVCRNDAIPVGSLVVAKLTKTLTPYCFVGIPAETNVIESTSAFLSHVRWLVLLHESVVTSLFLDPEPKLGVFWVIQRNQAISIVISEFLEVIDVSFPCSFLSIPSKVEFIKEFDALGGDGRILAVLEELVLLSLFRNPRC